MFEDLLRRHSLPYFISQFEIKLEGEKEIPLDAKITSKASFIFGLSVEIGDAGSLISTPGDFSKKLINQDESYRLWLSLNHGGTQYVQHLRLCNLVYRTPGLPNGNDKTYLSVSIPASTDWNKSKISNPESITGRYLMLNYLFLDEKTYKKCLQKGVLFQI